MVGTTMRMQTQYNSYKQLRVMKYRMPPLCEYRNAHHNTDMTMQRHVRLRRARTEKKQTTLSTKHRTKTQH